tara:strand:+ start:328 stop:699 length:372 start_codon:yes stop_codon:yes gene_type:complete
MPIYAYRCNLCNFSKDILQKLSDKHLVICPECGENSFARQLTAAGFVLKGSGWYVTDFKNGQKKEEKKQVTENSAENKPLEKNKKTKTSNSTDEKTKSSGGTDKTTSTSHDKSTSANNNVSKT